MAGHLIETKLREKIPDIDSKPKILPKLRKALMKVKEVLSVNSQADFMVSNLDSDFDYQGFY